MDDKIVIDEPWVQAEAEAVLGRGLSHEECLDVIYRISEDVFMLIQDKITLVTEHRALLERNKGAEKLFPHFVVFYRNQNAFQNEFGRVGIFNNEDDALTFIRHDGFLSKFDEWRVVQVDDRGTEKEIYKINC